MLDSVFLKSLRDQRWPTFWFGLALVAISLYTIMFFPLISEATGLLEFIENLPEELTAMFGGALDYSTAEGFLSGELFSFTGPLVVIAYAIFRGATAVAGEEESRTLDQLLANPVPRWQILLEKSSAMIMGIIVLGVLFWSALVVGGEDRPGSAWVTPRSPPGWSESACSPWPAARSPSCFPARWASATWLPGSPGESPSPCSC